MRVRNILSLNGMILISSLSLTLDFIQIKSISIKQKCCKKVEAAFVTVILQVCLTPFSPPNCSLNCLCISGELKDPQSTFPRTTSGRL